MNETLYCIIYIVGSILSEIIIIIVIKSLQKRKERIKKENLKKELKIFNSFKEAMKKKFYYHLDTDDIEVIGNIIPYYSNSFFPAGIKYDIKYDYYLKKPTWYEVKIFCVKSLREVEWPAEVEIYHKYSCYQLNHCGRYYHFCKGNCFAKNEEVFSVHKKLDEFLNSSWVYFKEKGTLDNFNSITNEKNFDWKPYLEFDTFTGEMIYEFEENKFKILKDEEKFFKAIGLDYIEKQRLKILIKGGVLKNLNLKSKRTGKFFKANLKIDNWEILKKDKKDNKEENIHQTETYIPKFKLEFINA